MPCRNSSPSLFLNLPLLIIILPTIAILLLLFAVPSLLSLNSHKVRPNTVNKGWDSLSVFLVLFAILCGIFARRNDEESANNNDEDDDRITHSSRNVVRSKAEQQHSSASNNWFDDYQFPDQKTSHSNPTFSTPVASTAGRLKRSSSSYPDLRQESLWESCDDQFRFFDDFEISKHRSGPTSSDYIHQRRQHSTVEESTVKEIPVDTFVLRRSVPSPPPQPKSPPPPPPIPPPPRADHIRSEKQSYRAVSDSSKEKVERDGSSGFAEIKSPPPTPPPPPPPPPPPQSDHEYRKSERKKSNATKEIRTVLASLYNQRKRKKKQKTRNLYDDTTLHLPSELPSFSRPPPPSPPPPPPPPPPSVFHNLFRKGSKSKRIHSFTPSTPPPPPPPPPPPSLSSSKRSSRRQILQATPASAPPPPAPPTPPPQSFGRRNSTSIGRPPLPTRVDNFNEENVNRGGQSPLIPMPPPPPPPFKVPGFRFVVKGDFVKIRSTHSSRCSSPDFDEIDRESTATVNVGDRPDGSGGPVFCPSPDVNVKADTFIARLRGEWRLEKINSMKEKRSMGQGPG